MNIHRCIKKEYNGTAVLYMLHCKPHVCIIVGGHVDEITDYV